MLGTHHHLPISSTINIILLQTIYHMNICEFKYKKYYTIYLFIYLLINNDLIINSIHDYRNTYLFILASIYD